MANVKKCDRCGAIYKDKAVDSYTVRCEHCNGYETVVDFCPHCSQMYFDFKFGSRLKDEEWEDGKVY